MLRDLITSGQQVVIHLDKPLPEVDLEQIVTQA